MEVVLSKLVKKTFHGNMSENDFELITREYPEMTTGNSGILNLDDACPRWHKIDIILRKKSVQTRPMGVIPNNRQGNVGRMFSTPPFGQQQTVPDMRNTSNAPSEDEDLDMDKFKIGHKISKIELILVVSQGRVVELGEKDVKLKYKEEADNGYENPVNGVLQFPNDVKVTRVLGGGKRKVLSRGDENEKVVMENLQKSTFGTTVHTTSGESNFLTEDQFKALEKRIEGNMKNVKFIGTAKSMKNSKASMTVDIGGISIAAISDEEILQANPDLLERWEEFVSSCNERLKDKLREIEIVSGMNVRLIFMKTLYDLEGIDDERMGFLLNRSKYFWYWLVNEDKKDHHYCRKLLLLNDRKLRDSVALRIERTIEQEQSKSAFQRVFQVMKRKRLRVLENLSLRKYYTFLNVVIKNGQLRIEHDFSEYLVVFPLTFKGAKRFVAYLAHELNHCESYVNLLMDSLRRVAKYRARQKFEKAFKEKLKEHINEISKSIKRETKHTRFMSKGSLLALIKAANWSSLKDRFLLSCLMTKARTNSRQLILDYPIKKMIRLTKDSSDDLLMTIHEYFQKVNGKISRHNIRRYDNEFLNPFALVVFLLAVNKDIKKFQSVEKTMRSGMKLKEDVLLEKLFALNIEGGNNLNGSGNLMNRFMKQTSVRAGLNVKFTKHSTRTFLVNLRFFENVLETIKLEKNLVVKQILTEVCSVYWETLRKSWERYISEEAWDVYEVSIDMTMNQQKRLLKIKDYCRQGMEAQFERCVVPLFSFDHEMPDLKEFQRIHIFNDDFSPKHECGKIHIHSVSLARLYEVLKNVKSYALCFRGGRSVFKNFDNEYSDVMDFSRCCSLAGALGKVVEIGLEPIRGELFDLGQVTRLLMICGELSTNEKKRVQKILKSLTLSNEMEKDLNDQDSMENESIDIEPVQNLISMQEIISKVLQSLKKKFNFEKQLRNGRKMMMFYLEKTKLGMKYNSIFVKAMSPLIENIKMLVKEQRKVVRGTFRMGSEVVELFQYNEI